MISETHPAGSSASPYNAEEAIEPRSCPQCQAFRRPPLRSGLLKAWHCGQKIHPLLEHQPTQSHFVPALTPKPMRGQISSDHARRIDASHRQRYRSATVWGLHWKLLVRNSICTSWPSTMTNATIRRSFSCRQNFSDAFLHIRNTRTSRLVPRFHSRQE